jgi:hypothetical protein
MLRITQAGETDLDRRLVLEGRLVGPWVQELERITRTMGTLADVSLDLTNLTFADPDGVSLLRRLRASGVTLDGGSNFLSVLVGGDDG